MGTDIHMAVERRVRGRWEVVELPDTLRDPWYVKYAATLPDSDPRLFLRYEPISRRSYDLFAVLADVRNGFGFAGVPTGGRIEPISAPRGFPDDLSPTVRGWLAERATDDAPPRLWMGDHSFSWVTVAELLAYPWATPHQKVGVITLEQFAARVASGTTEAPDDYSGAVWGDKISTIEDEEAETQLLAGGGGVPKGHKVYVRVRWSQPLMENGDFLERVIPGLRALDPDPNNVRLVFGFDS